MEFKDGNKETDMKRLIVIVGPNEVCKTTTSKCLAENLSNTA